MTKTDEVKIEELRNVIRYHCKRYYLDCESDITDYEFDLFEDRLESLERKHPQLVTPDSPTQCVGGKSALLWLERIAKRKRG